MDPFVPTWNLMSTLIALLSIILAVVHMDPLAEGKLHTLIIPRSAPFDLWARARRLLLDKFGPQKGSKPKPCFEHGSLQGSETSPTRNSLTPRPLYYRPLRPKRLCIDCSLTNPSWGSADTQTSVHVPSVAGRDRRREVPRD